MRDRILVNEQHWPPGHWQIGSAHEALGVLQVRMGDTIEAGGSFRRAAEIYAEALGPEHGWTAHAKAFLGTSLMAERRFAEAEEVLLEALKTLRVIQPGGEWTEDTVARMVLLYRAWGRTDEAERYQAMLSGDI